MTDKLFASSVATFCSIVSAIFSGCGLVATMLKSDVYAGYFPVYVGALILAACCGMLAVSFFGEFITQSLAAKEKGCPRSSSGAVKELVAQQATG